MSISKKKIIIISSIAAFVIIAGVASGILLGLKPWEKAEKPNNDYDDTITLAETNIDLVKSGKSDYKIVIPSDNNSKMMTFAVSELKLFFEEATGIVLETVTDDVVTGSDTKLISLGHTQQLEQKSYGHSYELLGRSGYIIKRDNERIFITGATDYGTAFGVYEFLQYQFDYEYYYKDTYSLTKNVRNEKLLDFDNITTASIDQTYLAIGEVIEDETHAHRLKTYTQEDVFLGFGASRWHTAFAIIGDMTPEQRALWVSDTGTQPCFSRDREGLSTHMAERITDGLRRDLGVTAVNIGQADNPNWCTCDASSAELAKYGTNSAGYILTINRIADKVQAWIDENQTGREFTITFFAYLATSEPPVKLVAGTTDEYEPIDEEVRLRDNVAVLNAPIAMNAYLHYDFYSAKNKGPALSTKKWAAMGGEDMYMWIYNNTFYGNYFTPAESFNGTQGTLKYLSEVGTRWVMQQGQQNNTISPDWSRLKAYIDAKLAWNIDANQDRLVKNFIKEYFGAASGIMQEYFDNYRTWYAYIAEQYDYTEHRTMVTEYYPRNVLNSWLGSIETAFREIEIYKAANPDLYEALYNRLLLESLSPRYLQMAIYRTDYTAAEQADKEAQFRRDCSLLNVIMLSEKAYIEGNALFA